MADDVPYDAVEQPELYYACRNNDVRTVKELIEAADASGGLDLASYWGESAGEGRKLPIHEARNCSVSLSHC